MIYYYLMRGTEIAHNKQMHASDVLSIAKIKGVFQYV